MSREANRTAQQIVFLQPITKWRCSSLLITEGIAGVLTMYNVCAENSECNDSDSVETPTSLF